MAPYPKPMPQLLNPTWQTFQSIASGAAAAAYSEQCVFSLATLEIDCPCGATSFALTEREQPGLWRWAVVNEWGRVVALGSEPSQTGAKRASAEALAALGFQ